jgi:ribulose 1,5-bisphosphate synthetase/thiazole synthase
MPRVRDWMNTNSWLVNIIVCGIFIVLILVERPAHGFLLELRYRFPNRSEDAVVANGVGLDSSLTDRNMHLPFSIALLDPAHALG